MQPWHFVVVSDPEVKRKIRVAAEAEEHIFYRRDTERKARTQPTQPWNGAEKSGARGCGLICARQAEVYERGRGDGRAVIAPTSRGRS